MPASDPTLPRTVRTTCPYCGVGCGVLASIDEQGVVSVKGDPQHPANQGRLCSKGAALAETVYLQDRLLYPEIAGEQVSWDQALATVAGRFGQIIDEHGPDAVAFYVSGQLLTEDYYVANKLMKGFIGSANIDTNSRLCMSSPVAAHKRAFGEDCVPCSYEDIDLADRILLVGSNLAWCHPVLFQRIARAKQRNPRLRVTVIDPRRTQTASMADVHLPLRPGSDGLLFNGLLAWLERNQYLNRPWLQHHVVGHEEALAAARETAGDVARVAEACGLDGAQVEDFYRDFAGHERVLTLFSQGVNQSVDGVDKGNAIINVHLATGRIGRAGMGPFSITGQPNAMGGREVGGLANTLAAHMEFDDPAALERLRLFWRAPNLATRPGLKALDLFEAIEQGRVKAVWIMATNPLVSLPGNDRFRRALEACELVVLSDCVRATDTAALAHVLLPALTWGERDGTVSNSDRSISRQRPFLAAPGMARADWAIITEVAHRMGFGRHFDYHSPRDIFVEHAALSGFENHGERLFDISALQDLDGDAYDRMEPRPWPIRDDRPEGVKRLFEDGRFATADGRARMLALRFEPPTAASADFPLVLNSGRVRDHWHTLTRTGVSPRLCAHTVEPYAELHREDAQRLGLADGQLVRVVGENGGDALLRLRVNEEQQPGCVFVPMHWNDRFSARARVGALIPPRRDPLSGQPDFKHARARVEACAMNWHGFILSASHRQLELRYARYWTRSRGRGLWRYEIAGDEQPADWATRARDLLGVDERDDWIEYHDRARNQYRAARFEPNGRLAALIFIGPDEQLPTRDWLISLFRQEALSPRERASLLSGEPPRDQQDAGRIVCACFTVGEKTLLQAIREQGLDSVEAIGQALQAGTNCGSCIPELKQLLARAGT